MNAQHIVVIDDDNTIATMLEQLLTADGHGVTVAREALVSVAGRPPNRILTDLRTGRFSLPPQHHRVSDSGKTRSPTATAHLAALWHAEPSPSVSFVNLFPMGRRRSQEMFPRQKIAVQQVRYPELRYPERRPKTMRRPAHAAIEGGQWYLPGRAPPFDAQAEGKHPKRPPCVCQVPWWPSNPLGRRVQTNRDLGKVSVYQIHRRLVGKGRMGEKSVEFSAILPCG